MCGRYALHARPEVIALQFGFDPPPELSPRFNIAPGTLILAVTGSPMPRTAWLGWGLIPPWVKDPAGAKIIINARAETVGEKPSFRGAFRSHRCLVPASGYFEWRTAVGGKQPFYICPETQDLFGIAALYDPRPGRPGGEGTCALITTPASAATRDIHDRMPAILRPGDYGRWLDPATRPETLLELLRPLADDVRAYPVSSRVNAVRSDDPQCIAAIDPRVQPR